MTRTLDSYFTDWVHEVFGFGYGTGERPILTALKDFLALCPESGCYDYEVLEKGVTPTVAWLLINGLCDHDVDVFEYGTSPRYAWLTNKGKRLKAFVASKTVDELIELACPPEMEFGCGPSYCNCSSPSGYVEGAICQNPFWLDVKGDE